MKTFWLYYAQKLITSVRMPAGSSVEQVRDHAFKNCKILLPGTDLTEDAFLSMVDRSTVVEHYI